MRINKYLASKGLASRRKAEELVLEGAVKINGKVVTDLATQVDIENDIVEVSAQVLEKKEEEKVTFALNKPEGYVSSTKKTKFEPHNVLDLFPQELLEKHRLFSVGRLDKESSGLLLMTTDGDLAFRLTHPSFEHEKEYYVEIFNELTDEMLSRLRQPFFMLGQKTQKARVKKVAPKAFTIILTEGKNRQIRRMVRSIGSGVRVLRRIRIEKFILPSNLSEGGFVQLMDEDLKKLS